LKNHSIKEQAGQDFPVIFRYGLKHYIKGLGAGALKGEKFNEAGRDTEEGLKMARLLEKAGVDALHVDAGSYDSWYWSHPPVYQEHGCLADMAAQVKRVVKIPVIAVGRLDIPELAEQVVNEGKADIVALGRGLLADPHWSKKVQAGNIEEIRPCFSCWDGCLGRGVGQHKPHSCAVNPASGRERLYVLHRVKKPTRVVVVGGGIAGMEAARVSAVRGCQVTMYEKSGEMGGHLLAASVPEFKKDLRKLMGWYRLQLDQLGVEIKLNTPATVEAIKESGTDRVILATGSTPNVPAIPGIDKANVATCKDLLLGKAGCGERGGDGGGRTGGL
jgi:2-enoate reductase